LPVCCIVQGVHSHMCICNGDQWRCCIIPSRSRPKRVRKMAGKSHNVLDQIDERRAAGVDLDMRRRSISDAHHMLSHCAHSGTRALEVVVGSLGPTTKPQLRRTRNQKVTCLLTTAWWIVSKGAWKAFATCTELQSQFNGRKSGCKTTGSSRNKLKNRWTRKTPKFGQPLRLFAAVRLAVSGRRIGTIGFACSHLVP